MAEREIFMLFGILHFQLYLVTSRCPFLGTFNWKHRDYRIEGFSLPDARK